jgi:hypothetical protein
MRKEDPMVAPATATARTPLIAPASSDPWD